ncbi:hypothetical protein D3C81_1871250 [compost metagenome]
MDQSDKIACVNNNVRMCYTNFREVVFDKIFTDIVADVDIRDLNERFPFKVARKVFYGEF